MKLTKMTLRYGMLTSCLFVGFAGQCGTAPICPTSNQASHKIAHWLQTAIITQYDQDWHFVGVDPQKTEQFLGDVSNRSTQAKALETIRHRASSLGQVTVFKVADRTICEYTSNYAKNLPDTKDYLQLSYPS